jgi:hypothetical protein
VRPPRLTLSEGTCNEIRELRVPNVHDMFQKRVGERSVSAASDRRRKPEGQGWQAFGSG